MSTVNTSKSPTAKRITMRPCLDISSIRLLYDLLIAFKNNEAVEKTGAETILIATTELVLLKELMKVDTGIGITRIGNKSMPVPISLETLGANSSDKEKFAAMSSTDSAAAIQLVEDTLMAELAGVSLEEYRSGKQ